MSVTSVVCTLSMPPGLAPFPPTEGQAFHVYLSARVPALLLKAFCHAHDGSDFCALFQTVLCKVRELSKGKIRISHLCLTISGIVTLRVDHFSFVSRFLGERRDLSMESPGFWVEIIG